MSLVDTILQVTPQPEVTWIQVRRSCRPRIWNTSGDNAFICEGFTKQTLNLATDMRWYPILHKNSGLNTVTFLQGRNHTLHMDVFVLADVTVHWTDPFGVILSKKNGPRIKVLVNPHHTVTYAECNGHSCTTSGLVEPHIRQFCVFTAPSSVKCASSIHRIFSGLVSFTSIRTRN